MIELKRQSAEVYFAKQPISAIGVPELRFLKEAAMRSTRHRCRICLHLDEQALLHETVLVYTRATYNRPNRHPMAESFHLLEGACDVLFFEDEPEPTSPSGFVAPSKVLHMEAAVRGNGHPFIVQFPVMVYHTIVVRSDWLVIHETCRGPFVRGHTTLYAPWAPAETDHDVGDFLAKLEGYCR
jgi:cupin fold WbuC family metalloprotein